MSPIGVKSFCSASSRASGDRAGPAPLVAYETTFASVVGARMATAFGYGRTALRAVLNLPSIDQRDEVILSPLTCKVVPLAILASGLRPVYADIGEGSLNLDPGSVADALGQRTRAILFQHTYGSGRGLAEVAAVAEAAGIMLIEDRAQCMPRADDWRCSSKGVVGFYSNNLLKPLPAGAGGMAVTDDPDLASALRATRDRLEIKPGAGRRIRARLARWVHDHVLTPERYWPLYRMHRAVSRIRARASLDEEIAHEIEAASVRLTPAQARWGSEALESVSEAAEHRKLCVHEYTNQLDARFAISEIAPLYYYPIRSNRKQELLRRARRDHVEIVAWPRMTPIYPVDEPDDLGRYGYQPGSCPRAESTARELVGLPTHRRIDSRERQRTIALIHDFLQVAE